MPFQAQTPNTRRTYAGTKYLKPEDCRDQPLKEQIAVVKPPAENAKYPKPSLIFESGKTVSLNQTSIGLLMNEFGIESWIGKWVTLGAEMIDVFSGQTEAIIVRPLNGAASPSGKAGRKSGDKDLDDQIPF
jgi:hypothetical protein